jgi:hypothetical protein
MVIFSGSMVHVYRMVVYILIWSMYVKKSVRNNKKLYFLEMFSMLEHKNYHQSNTY